MKTALVTGTSKGIGKATAKHLINSGWGIVDGCSRWIAGWSQWGYHHHECDVTDHIAVRAMLGSIRKMHGRLDALVCNAGTASMNHVLTMPIGTARRIMETNFIGTFLCCREAVKLMRKTGGRIVTVSSVAVPLALEGEAVYAASKSAIEPFTKVLAKEVAPWGITVNCVGPAPIETDLLRGVPDDKLAAICAKLTGRPATMADVMNVIDFFISPSSGTVTGQVVYLGGA